MNFQEYIDFHFNVFPIYLQMYDAKNLPRIACGNCLDRLKMCMNTLEYFKEAQTELRRNNQVH